MWKAGRLGRMRDASRTSAPLVGAARASTAGLAAGRAPAYALAMAGDRQAEAIARIERALQRIEAAASARPAPAGDDEELRQLRDTHQKLRGKVEGAIAQIDRLLEREGA
jgi:hypothetical protein